MPERHHIHLRRIAAAAVLAGATLGGPSTAHAAEVPAPLSSTAGRATAVLSGPPAPVAGVGETVEDAVEPLTDGSGRDKETTPAPEDGGASEPGAADGQTAPAQASEPERGGAAQAPPAGSSRAGSVRASTPAATVCVMPTGAGSPAFELDLEAAGVDLSSPLVEQFPQAFAACPEGAVPVGEEKLASVDGAVEGLLGACIRITREVAPLQTTLVVLERNVIEELTEAGLPLRQLVVPCPGAGGGDDDGSGAARPSAEDASGGQAHNQAASATQALPSRLAFTGANPGPLAAVASGLLCVGALLTRKAWLLARPDRPGRIRR